MFVLLKHNKESLLKRDMENSTSSIEKQIDNFLEQFKRSASKAKSDWPNSIGTASLNSTASVNHSNMEMMELSGML